jgi:HSP20 family protein
MFSLVPFTRGYGLTKRKGNYGLGSIFDDFYNGEFFPAFNETANPIKADIKETDKEFIIEAEMPGLKKKDINLKLDDNTITISVEKNEEKSEEKDNYVRKERSYGSYSRSFYIENIRTDDINAEYKDGILKVNLPKAEEVKEEAKKIEIK